METVASFTYLGSTINAQGDVGAEVDIRIAKAAGAFHMWRKQVFRSYDTEGRMVRDVLTAEGDAQSGEPLVAQVMAAGKRIGPPEPLAVTRNRVLLEIESLPECLRGLEDSATPMQVEVAPVLRALADAVDRVAR